MAARQTARRSARRSKATRARMAAREAAINARTAVRDVATKASRAATEFGRVDKKRFGEGGRKKRESDRSEKKMKQDGRVKGTEISIMKEREIRRRKFCQERKEKMRWEHGKGKGKVSDGGRYGKVVKLEGEGWSVAEGVGKMRG